MCYQSDPLCTLNAQMVKNHKKYKNWFTLFTAFYKMSFWTGLELLKFSSSMLYTIIIYAGESININDLNPFYWSKLLPSLTPSNVIELPLNVFEKSCLLNISKVRSLAGRNVRGRMVQYALFFFFKKVIVSMIHVYIMSGFWDHLFTLISYLHIVSLRLSCRCLFVVRPF